MPMSVKFSLILHLLSLPNTQSPPPQPLTKEANLPTDFTQHSALDFPASIDE